MSQDSTVANARVSGGQAATGAPDSKRWLALAVIALAQLMVVLDATVVNIALPQAQAALNITDRRPAVDGHRLHPGLRGPAAARRSDRRLLRPQADLPHRPDRLRRRLGAGRCRGQRRHPLRRPGAAGRLRRTARAGRAVPAHRHLHRAQGAGQGVRRLRRHLRRRRRDRPDLRRPAHRVRQLALVPAGQHPGRADRLRGRAAAGPGEQGARQHPLRHPRRHPGHRRPGPPWCSASPRPPDRRLDFAGDPGVAGRRAACCWPRSSWWESRQPTTRCCRCGWCWTATGAPPTSSRS